AAGDTLPEDSLSRSPARPGARTPRIRVIMTDIRKGTCPLCEHNEIIQAAPVDFTQSGVYPQAVAHGSKWMKERAPDRPLGVLNVFVCRNCGFAQWFAFKPEEIPIGEEHGTRLISRPVGGP